jgi:hypothetical protein
MLRFDMVRPPFISAGFMSFDLSPGSDLLSRSLVSHH